ncbi:MAG: Nif3-like dinuclear metal center hexameric protein [Duodenibacillus sp.]|nr:Nif3-like dinuclear metal center hexameric protein [Duodenibacillus sp.]
MKDTELAALAAGWLEPERFHDYCPNGLQVSGARDIRRIVTGVTASLELIEKAAALEADALVVHHGWFWKHDDPRITGTRYGRVRALMDAGMALIAFHLPLDAHPEFGNNALLARALGLTPQGRFGEQDLGWTGACEPEPAAGLAARIEAALGRAPLVVNPGERPLSRVAWCTGAAQDMIEEAAAAGAEAFISGEISERTTWLAYYPCSGRNCNAFDLVRIHLYGDQDEDTKPDTPVNKLPSYIAMQDLCNKDEAVHVELENPA